MTAFQDKPLLMIVDDERNFAESLRLALEDVFQVRVTCSLYGARTELGRIAPDAVLMDLRLPDGEGVELIQEIKNLAAPPPVFLMTAHANSESLAKALEEGVVACFTKPLDIQELKRALGAETWKRTAADKQPAEN